MTEWGRNDKPGRYPGHPFYPDHPDSDNTPPENFSRAAPRQAGRSPKSKKQKQKQKQKLQMVK
jgi:hypothetical protein